MNRMVAQYACAAEFMGKRKYYRPVPKVPRYLSGSEIVQPALSSSHKNGKIPTFAVHLTYSNTLRARS